MLNFKTPVVFKKLEFFILDSVFFDSVLMQYQRLIAYHKMVYIRPSAHYLANIFANVLIFLS